MTKSYPVTIEEIEQKTYELGWNDVGITKALIPEEDILAYHDWLKNSYQGKLSYMENALRCDPQKLFPGAKTAILFISYYKQEPRPFRTDAGLIASYARGRDYHHVHRKRLKQFIRWLEERCGQTDIAKAFSDSSPILEKALAVQAGLGWFGKNTLLIHRRFGTFTLLSGLLTSVEIPLPKIQLSELRLPRCGSCTKCLDACPTQALVSPYKLDATRCLSYHLIESKEPIPPDIQSQNPGYVFGCDICQDVCPHNLRKPFSEQPEFKEEKGWGAYLSLEDLPQLQQHKETLFGTPLQRRKVEGLKHTLETLKKRDIMIQVTGDEEEEKEIFKHDSWRVFRIISEFVDGFETMTTLGPSVSIFGSARLPPDSQYYTLAVDVAQHIARKGFAIITGGGPGIMEAANKGSQEVKGYSCGLAIDLPFESESNRYIDPKYRLKFRYFFIRKVMFIRYAQGYVFLPGGYGTLDELFEALTLIQTKKIKPFPIYLMGKAYWIEMLKWIENTMLQHGCISKEDLDLFQITDDPEEVANGIERHYQRDRAMRNF